MKLSDALKICHSISDSSAEGFRVYLACGIFPLHLTTFLTAHLSKRLPKRAVEIQTGLYGDLAGNLELLGKSRAHAGVIVIEWSDLDQRLGLRRLGGWGPHILPDILADVKRNTSQLLQLLEAAAQSIPLALCLPTIPLPPIFYQPSEQTGLDHLLLEKTLYDFGVRAAQIPHVKIVNHQRLDMISPISDRLDVKSELSTGFPYRTEHASKVAELLSALLQPQPPKKGLITDLDDTLWRGLLGEDGIEGVSWNLDQGSHIHALYQQLLLALSDSGVMIGVASKNDPALVTEALAREDLLLPNDRLFPIEVNWGPKSQSVGRILEAWNINADSVVFVDDNAMELAEVNSIHPEVECLLFPRDDERLAYEALEKLRGLFGKQAILEEDAIRIASLRNANRFHQSAKSESGQPLHTFLAALDAELTFSPVSPGDPRGFELVNKTNQFNLNGRRFNEAEFAAVLNRPGAVSLLVSYKDKYGPLGKIAVLLGQREKSIVKIDTWVMSCRAFSRHIEYKCLNYLFETLEVSEIELDFLPTTRNSLGARISIAVWRRRTHGTFQNSTRHLHEAKPYVLS
jgi:FkbH-like protein